MAATWALTDEEWSLVDVVFDPPGRRRPKAKRDRRTMVMADQGYRIIADQVFAEHLVMFETRAWEEKPAEGFKPIRPLWRVEDAFARLGAWRRMSRCFEATAAGASTWLEVACVGVLLARRRQMLAGAVGAVA